MGIPSDATCDAGRVEPPVLNTTDRSSSPSLLCNDWIKAADVSGVSYTIDVADPHPIRDSTSD
jgi:hypothetical protein